MRKQTINNISFYLKKGILSLKEKGWKKTCIKIVELFQRKLMVQRLKRNLMLGEVERKKQEETTFSSPVKFSILVPLYNTPLEFLKEMIQSVVEQTYPIWELCLADGSDSKDARAITEYCLKMQKKDSRIKYKKLEKNGGISENTNACIEMATGEYIALFDHDDVLHPSALYEMMTAIEKEQADFLFSDEVVFQGTLKNIVTIHFKSDYAIDTLRSNNYICHFTVFHRELLNKAGNFRKEYDGSQDHDLILRLTKEAKHIYHIPKILYFWRSHSASVAADINAKPYASLAGRKAVQASIEEYGQRAVVESESFCSTIYRVRYEIKGTPLISIIIPCKKYGKEVQRCIKSIQKLTTYSNYEILLLESKEQTKETIQHKNIRILNWDKKFNYAEAMNDVVSKAKGDYYVFLHDDVQIITPQWLEELLMYAQRLNVGVVGAKEYYKNNTVRQAGVLLQADEDTILQYPHQGQLRENNGYMGRLSYVQNVSAVSNSCMMIRKDVYKKVHGFQREFFYLSAADLCLRLRTLGYWIVFTPYAEVYHFKLTKEKKKQKEIQRNYQCEKERFMKTWKEELKKGDAYFGWNFKKLKE